MKKWKLLLLVLVTVLVMPAFSAPKEKKELSDARKVRAKEVEDAYKACLDANKHYRDKLNKFIDDYGSFHMTFDTEIDSPFSFFDFLF